MFKIINEVRSFFRKLPVVPAESAALAAVRIAKVGARHRRKGLTPSYFEETFITESVALVNGLVFGITATMAVDIEVGRETAQRGHDAVHVVSY